MKKIKLVVFDMDGTLLQARSCWKYIHQHFGIDNKEMLQRYMEHKINDLEFAESDIQLWEQNSDVHINEAYINSILDEIEPIDGAEDLIQSLHHALQHRKQRQQGLLRPGRCHRMILHANTIKRGF